MKIAMEMFKFKHWKEVVNLEDKIKIDMKLQIFLAFLKTLT